MSRLAIVSVIALPITAATAALPAGASTASGHFLVVGTHPLKKPANSDIVGQGSTAKYTPSKLTAPEYSKKTCVPKGKDISFTVANTGTKTAYVTYEGSPAFSLKKDTGEEICFYGGKAGDTAAFGLSNKTGSTSYASTLTITFSS
jgi:hypothetical protein